MGYNAVLVLYCSGFTGWYKQNTDIQILLFVVVSQTCYRAQAGTVVVDGVGTCIAAVDYIMAVCRKSKTQSQECVINMLRGKAKDEVAKILCRKAVMPGFWEPTYVITVDECWDLLDYLPRVSVRAARKVVFETFKRVHVGDQSLHDEIDRNATTNTPIQQGMRESMPGMPMLQARGAPLDLRTLKRRRILLELGREELALDRAKLDLERDKFDLERMRSDFMAQKTTQGPTASATPPGTTQQAAPPLAKTSQWTPSSLAPFRTDSRGIPYT